MSIASQFANWLAVAERDGKGGASAEPPAIDRGRGFVMFANLAAHPDFGDWTVGTFAARLRAAPDAGGSPLATYTCTTGTPAGGVTRVTLSLPVAAQTGLPAGDPATGLAELFLDLVFTPTGLDPVTIISTRQLVRGVI